MAEPSPNLFSSRISDLLLRLLMTFVLLVATAVPGVAQDDSDNAEESKEEKKDCEIKNCDIENIGNRDINGGGFLGLGSINFSSYEEEIALGRSLAADVDRQVQLVDDPVILEYVNRVGQNLVRNSDARVPFTFKVIEDDSINAMALPGGFVYVNTGVILTADEEAELAGVMAHEIAHVTARHGTENQSKGTLMEIASIPLIFLGGVVGIAAQQAAGIGIPASMYSFSRGAEEEADYLGTQYMYKTGYDPVAAVTFFEKVQAMETARPGSMSSIFSSHPPTEDRISKTMEKIELVLPEKDQYVLTTSEFAAVQSRLRAYYNRVPMEEEDENRPSLRRRTQRPDEADVTVEREAGPPRLERNGGSSEAAADPGDAEVGAAPETDSDRPVLRRREGSTDPDL